MKHFGYLLLFTISFQSYFSQTDTIQIHYYENYPFAYREAGQLRGLEIEIVGEYLIWLKQKKNIDIYPKYKAFKEFSAFYNSILDANVNTVGLGSVTDTQDRRRGIVFSPPYLQNTAVLVTDGSVPTIKSKDPAEVATVLKGMKPLVVNKSNHVTYMNDVLKVYNQTALEVPDLIISITEKQTDVLQKIIADKSVFGYVDIIAFWAYVRDNTSRFLKIQKMFTEPKEFLGFIMPKRNTHSLYLNEFFESGFGFTATKRYRQILEKYLGEEIIESVEIK